MADSFEIVVKNFSGLSSETKPTIAAGDAVPNGSRWREVDTGKVWHFNLADDTWYLAERTIDASTHAINTIDYAHHEIHGGSGWDISEVATLPADDFLDIRITTAAGTKYAHLTVEYNFEDESEWWIYEDVDLDLAHGAGDSVSLTPRNHRRPSGDTGSIITASYVVNTNVGNANADTDVTDGAILLAHGQMGAGRNKPTEGSSREEWILLPAEDYTIRFEDIGGSGGYVAFHLDWYQHTDKA